MYQGNLFEEFESTQTTKIQIAPGLQLQHRHTGQVMTVEEGNVIHLDNGTIPEGIIRQYLQDGTFVINIR